MLCSLYNTMCTDGALSICVCEREGEREEGGMHPLEHFPRLSNGRVLRPKSQYRKGFPGWGKLGSHRSHGAMLPISSAVFHLILLNRLSPL